MKKRVEDEVPLTEIPPSITLETKARFESLLNAALNNESTKSSTQSVDQCVVDIEKSDQPKPCPRTVTLQRKKILLPGSGKQSRGNSSGSTRSSEDVVYPGLKKLNRRSQIVLSAEVHSSSKQSLLSSPEKVSTSDDDTLTTRNRPKVLPRTNVLKDVKNTSGWANGSDTESSEVANERKLKTIHAKPALTTDVIEQAISSDTSDLVVAKIIPQSKETISRDNSLSDEKPVSENSPLKVKVPVPLPRRSLPTSQKSGSTSDENSLNKNKKPLEEEVPVSEQKNVSATSLNVLSSSSHDMDHSSIATRKKVRRRKKIKKHESPEQEGIEMAEIHSSAKSIGGTEYMVEKVTERQTSSSGSTMLGVTIHGTDSLQPHTLLRHPMVRVLIVDSTCGEYIKKSDPNRCVSFCEEEVDYILPIMTRHFDFKEHRTMTPMWEEVLIFNEDISHIVKPDTLLFFEIVDFVNFTIGGLRYHRLGHDSGWHYVAWAFLKLVAVTGEKNTEKKLRLQLYKPRLKYNVPRKPTSPVVFDWWKEGVTYAKKYSSTLYVTVGSVTPPSAPLTPNLRSRVAIQNEQSSVASIASTPAFITDDDDFDGSQSFQKSSHRAVSPREPPVSWSRLPAQSCKLTNNSLANIPISPSGGFSLAFSHAGLHLACGTSGPIFVFSVPGFKLRNTLNGHRGLVYSIRWSNDDHYLISASADCTACVWDVRRGRALQVLVHPSFVYCADFVPKFGRRVLITGCCDGTLRVWRSLSASKFNLTQELSGHSGFIGALCFDSDGLTIISGDSFGQLMVWSCDLESVEWTCSREVKQREMKGVIINNLVLHPGGNRLLIHTRDSMLRMVDIPTFAVIQWFQGCMNEHIQTGSTVSSCGGIVFSCSEDGLMCAWDSNTGTQLGLYADIFPTSASAAVAYHPHEHMMAIAAHTPGTIQPLIISTFDRSSTGESMNLRLFEVENSLPLQVKDNKSNIEKDEDMWQKLESLSSQRLGSVVDSSIHTSQASTNFEENRFLKPYDSNNRLIKSKKKKKRIDKKESSWSKLAKASGFLVEVTTNKGEINRGFEIDNFSTKSSENLLNNICNRSNIANQSSSHPDKLADIIERMDKVLQAATKS